MSRSRTTIVTVVAVSLFWWWAPYEARAGAPTDQLRSDLAALFAALTQGTHPDGDQRAAEVLDRMFDWPRMARATLRGHWQSRTPAEQAEFTRLFASVFRRAYLSRASVVDASKFRYLGDTSDGDRATVKTTILTKRGSTVDVDYLVRQQDDRWRVEDVFVERVSLIESYRAQFDAVVTRASYAALADRLRKVAQAPSP